MGNLIPIGLFIRIDGIIHSHKEAERVWRLSERSAHLSSLGRTMFERGHRHLENTLVHSGFASPNNLPVLCQCGLAKDITCKVRANLQ